METNDWHIRFLFQTLWTRQLRSYLYNDIGFSANDAVLDIGCGTGALLPELSSKTEQVFGIDVDFERLLFAVESHPLARLNAADAYALPYRKHAFDICLCHYLLLWIERPKDVLLEMKRVTKPGGHILVLAETDYDARFDHPVIFKEIGKYQNQSLQEQGVRLDTGRRLKEYFIQAGMDNVKMGMLSGEWKKADMEQFELEWLIIAYDLQKVLDEKEINRFYDLARDAWAQGDALSFIPTFYAWAQV